ncbi:MULTISPECIES: monovalent cation:proton antiporter-2 (CPA2) family protein [Phenylobacterium]|jgi:glutathione-regulated potassium-efflux system ancillary protein KefC/glutathione-regulated potassium-efflux system protein KefB|uniref:Monovalent cation:proton antiporter-2 (CPA2) family protein n=1 Tax=Phenylobacterium conjunctum TaxID=1298959 RepID=A0ABW3T576_9CAUL
MHGQDLLIQALVYLTAGVISVPIAKRLGLGSVLGYLIAGVLVGPFVLDLVGEAHDVMTFAEFGVVILLFLIGLEVRPALLWRMKTAIFGLGGGQLALTAIAVGAGALTLGMSWKPALATGLILAMSSTAIVLANLEERGLRQGPVGEAVFGVLLFQDLAVIPLFAILPLLAVHPAAAEAATHAGGIADLPAWQQAGLAMAAIAAVVFGGRYAIRPVFRFIAAARLREIFTAFALLLVVAVAALMELVGLSPALGAFLAGVVLAESEFRRELETDIEPFRGLLLGLFFITVGAGLDFDVVMSKPLLILTLVLGMMGLKAVAMYLTGRALGLTRPEAGVSAVALAQGGEFAFVLISFTVGARILPAEYGKLLSAVVAVSMALTPIAFALYARFVLNRSVAEGAAPEETAFDEAPQVIVAGHGRFGQIVSRLLLANDIPTVTLDSSIEQIELLRRFGREVHYGDAGRLDLLRAAGAEKAKLLLIAIDDQDRAVEIVEAARDAFPHLTILARAFDRRHAYDLLRKGADGIERETFEGSLKFGESALKALGFSTRRATKAASLFRKHDIATFERLAPVWGEDRYILASRDAAETMDRLLRADLDQMDLDDEDETAPKTAKAS